MAKVKVVQMCKSCKAQLIEVDQKACHKCGFRQFTDHSSRFNVPDYLFYQKNDMAEADPNIDKVQLEKDMVAFMAKSQDDDRISAMHDALNFLRVMVVSECTVDTIRTVTKIGKQIGVLSLDIENYAKHGGAINVSQPKIINFDETELGDAESSL